MERRRIPVLEAGAGLAPMPATEDDHEDEAGHGDEDGHGDGHGHGGVDPHVWLDPQLAILQVARIRDALSALDPARAEAFTRRATDYMHALQALDAQYRNALRDAPVRRFIAYHGGYGHLAARYGLEQIPVLQGDSLGGPSAARVAEIITLARREGLGTIFAEPQFSRRAVTALAQEAGLRVSTLDALGTTPDSTYIAMMTRNLEQLREALFP
jgi:zinc transport system substrate-binding protein